ncbi:hypothetical protein L3Q82_023167 [Scortum barcoo]|uniref:Uncharacterized protein n=1 Tax=Scortum barcoo TaxID=214431 RepID=A0ACB8WY51_9TELE|nr:hypothetical protein L3Q82_023167 [Scortum barcoo]
MQLYGALVLLVTLSAGFGVFQTICDNLLYFFIALGLRCYACENSQTRSCPDPVTCSASEDRCATVKVNNLYVMGCLSKALCVQGVDCCRGDLCNGAIPTGKQP